MDTTNFDVTVCKTHHLTAFAGFYVPPNPLPIPSFALLKKGYTLLVTVIIILLLYIVGLVLTRRFDKTDSGKVNELHCYMCVTF